MSNHVLIIRILLVCLAASWMGSTAVADEFEFRFANGSSWRGDKGDEVEVTFKENGVEQRITGRVFEINGDEPGFRLVVIEGDVAGRVATKGIFEGDIVSISARGAAPGKGEGSGRPRPARPDEVDSNAGQGESDAQADAGRPGVFLLPWEGTVGGMARHDEIEAIAAEADKYGPGQTIVLAINSPGGLVSEGDEINKTLLDVKKRHRVIAWIKKAISAGAFTALHCDEIYFMKVGAMGSAVMFSGETAISGQQLDAWVKDFGDVAEAGGRNRIPAECMVTRTKMASYDKDPETGKVTWYPDMRGEFKVSDDTQVLTINADPAMHSNFIDGIADTEDELAVLLRLPEWHEINDSGRRIHRRWKETIEACKREVPRIMRDLQIKPPDQQIRLYEELLGWYRRCGYMPMMIELRSEGVGGLPPEDELRRSIDRLRRARAQRGRD